MVRMEDTTDLKVAHLPAEENALSRRYLRIIEKWVHVGVEYFQRWPERPNCGHFFGGVHAYGLESFSPAEAFAFASTSSEFDEKAAGVSKDELREMAIQAVRYLCFTHDSGPAECVRPSVGFGREKFLGTKWGERGQGFFRESQCGHAVAGLARICLLLRDWVDDETWMMVARVQEDYAERFGSMEPKSGVYRDTQMEENFWTSHGLSACYLFLSRHEKAAAWEAMTRRWMYSTCSAPQDTKDFGLVGAETASDLAFKTFTSLPDYWAENHGMVHPSYTAAGVRALMAVGTQLKMWGRDLPPELFWNRRRIYENLKAMTDGAGYAQAVQGMDWHYLPAAGIDVPHAIASVFFDDPDAAALQLRGLENTERRQEGNGGRFYDREFAEKAHDQIDAMILRELHIRDVGQLYFMHRIFGPGADPAPQRELEARLMGVRTYPHAGFVHHRHARGQTSFSWRNSIMALPLTREGIYTISPCSDSWLGHPVVKDRPDSHRLKAVRVAEYDGGFAAAMTMDRCQESLRQQVLFASLPDGCVLSFERFVAQEDLVIQSLDQGFLQIANENFPLFAPNCCGVRTLYHPEGSTEYEGWFGDAESEDVVDALGRPSWLNIDGRMGIVFSGTGQTVYHNRHFFEVYRVIADDLTLSRQQGDLSLCSGESAGHLAALLIPEQAHVETASASFSTLTGPENSICLAANGFWAMANFDAGCRSCTFSQARLEEIPFLPGVRVEAKGAGLEYTVVLEGGHAALFQATGSLRSNGEVRVDVMPEGTVYVSNIGKDKTSVVCGEETVEMAPGETNVMQAAV